MNELQTLVNRIRTLAHALPYNATSMGIKRTLSEIEEVIEQHAKASDVSEFPEAEAQDESLEYVAARPALSFVEGARWTWAKASAPQVAMGDSVALALTKASGRNVELHERIEELEAKLRQVQQERDGEREAFTKLMADANHKVDRLMEGRDKFQFDNARLREALEKIMDTDKGKWYDITWIASQALEVSHGRDEVSSRPNHEATQSGHSEAASRPRASEEGKRQVEEGS